MRGEAKNHEDDRKVSEENNLHGYSHGMQEKRRK
jgi:hypothetical protein